MSAKTIGFVILAIVAALTLFLKPAKSPKNDSAFVGKWESSRMQSPVRLFANGEWEMQKEDGTVLKYGVWRYEDKQIIWSFLTDRGAIHDPNPIVSFTPNEFTLKERTGAITVFRKLADR